MYSVQLELHPTPPQKPKNQSPHQNTTMPWNFRFLAQGSPCDAQENLPRRHCFESIHYLDVFHRYRVHVALYKVKIGVITLTFTHGDFSHMLLFFDNVISPLDQLFWQYFPLILSLQNDVKPTLNSTADQLEYTQYINFKQSGYYL